MIEGVAAGKISVEDLADGSRNESRVLKPDRERNWFPRADNAVPPGGDAGPPWSYPRVSDWRLDYTHLNSRGQLIF